MEKKFSSGLTDIRKVTVIGAGNAGTQVAYALFRKGIHIQEIHSPSFENASKLAKKVNASYIREIHHLNPDSDLFLFCVPDSYLKKEGHKWPFPSKLVAHLSGSTPMECMASFSSRYGVFYPLQTLSKKRKINFTSVPILIESNSAEDQVLLQNLASLISDNVLIIDSEKRKMIHLAAVFVNNFSNHLYTIAGDLLDKQGISIEILKPLILETARKACQINPYSAQTGPAVRHDQSTIDSHLEMMETNPDYKEIYMTITRSIQQTHNI